MVLSRPIDAEVNQDELRKMIFCEVPRRNISTARPNSFSWTTLASGPCEVVPCEYPPGHAVFRLLRLLHFELGELPVTALTRNGGAAEEGAPNRALPFPLAFHFFACSTLCSHRSAAPSSPAPTSWQGISCGSRVSHSVRQLSSFVRQFTYFQNFTDETGTWFCLSSRRCLERSFSAANTFT